MIKMPGIRACVLGLALIPVTIISVVLSFQLIIGKIADLDQALRERTASMTRQLGPAAEYGVASGNLEALQGLIDKAASEPDVQGIRVFSDNGIEIARAGRARWRNPTREDLPRDRLYAIELSDRLVYYAPITRTEIQVNDFSPVSNWSGNAEHRRANLLGWVSVEVSRNATLQSQRKALIHSLYVLLAGLGVSFYLAWLIGRQITRPILALTHTLNRLGEGHLSERVAVDGLGELGLLQRGINSMASHLQSINEQMQEKVDQATARLVYQAGHDSLTGLINRWEFERRLESALETALQQGREHVLCYMDLDQFKIINDTSGHGAGDELLRQLALILKNDLRERDTLARLGGDEFALLLENCSIEAAMEVVDSLRGEVQRYRFQWEERVYAVGMSVGMVAINAMSSTAANLLSAADTACYVAKDRGRNRIHVYESRDSELARHRGEMQWITRIHKSIEENRLHLVWQEVYRIQDMKISPNKPPPCHLEILLRMKGEDGMEILPMAFIPAAERYLIMPLLDTWVIEETLKLCRRYIDLKNGMPCLFAVNLSGASLKDAEFRRVLLELLRNQPDTGPHLCFEITETATLGNLSIVNDFIQVMREFGCRFALDDFGSGLSSFTYLKNLKVDFLKIDGAFVRDIETNALDRSMVDAIHRLGHQMGLFTVAEYVESEQALAILRQLGVDCAQGNLLHQPAPIETFWQAYKTDERAQ